MVQDIGGYDAALGRFLQVDPLAHRSGGHSPYNYAFNDPVLFNDPMGDYPREVQIWREQNRGGAAYDYEIDFFSGGSGGGSYSGFGGPGSGSHWTDRYSHHYRDYFLMDAAEFELKYGITPVEYHDHLIVLAPYFLDDFFKRVCY